MPGNFRSKHFVQACHAYKQIRGSLLAVNGPECLGFDHDVMKSPIRKGLTQMNSGTSSFLVTRSENLRIGKLVTYRKVSFQGLLKKAASGVLAIIPCSRTRCTLCAQKWLRPCWADFFEPTRSLCHPTCSWAFWPLDIVGIQHSLSCSFDKRLRRGTLLGGLLGGQCQQFIDFLLEDIKGEGSRNQ